MAQLLQFKDLALSNMICMFSQVLFYLFTYFLLYHICNINLAIYTVKKWALSKMLLNFIV